MGSKKASRSETHSIKTTLTTPTAPNSAITPSTASTVAPCPHSDGTIPVCWDCVEAGHPSAGAAAAVSAGNHDVVSPLSEKRHKRSKASIFSKLSSRASHSTLQVHPPEPGKEVIVADYQHLSQPGLEVLAGPRAVNPTSPSYYKNSSRKSDAANANANKTNKRADTENWDVESSTDRNRASSVRSQHGRIRGMREKRFWLSALLIGLLVVVITVGIVVGMQQTGKFAKNTSAQANGGSGTSTTSADPGAAPTASSSPGGMGPITCPSANNSTYTLPDSGNVKFKVGCGYSRDGGDLQSITAGTFLECMQECAKRTGCAGVSWINDGDAGSANNYCYTKLAMDGKMRNNVFAQSAELVTG